MHLSRRTALAVLAVLAAALVPAWLPQAVSAATAADEAVTEVTVVRAPVAPVATSGPATYTVRTTAAGTPVAGAVVRFAVVSGPSAPSSGTCLVPTGGTGETPCRYTTGPDAGTDAVELWVDRPGGVDGVRDEGEAFTTLEVVLVAAPPPAPAQAHRVALGPDVTVQTGGTATVHAVVTSAQGRRVPGVRVLFVESGAGSFPGAAQRVEVVTDATGQASASVEAVPGESGSQEVTALLDGGQTACDEAGGRCSDEVVVVYGSPTVAPAPEPTPRPTTPPPPGDAPARLLEPGQTSSSGGDAVADAPVQTTITMPEGLRGFVSVDAQPASGSAPAGFTALGLELLLEGPAATAAAPYTVVFELDAASLDGLAVDDVQVLREGVAVPACDAGSGGAATPDPCVVSRATDADGDALLTVLTSHFSAWALAARVPLAPLAAVPAENAVRAGATVPVRWAGTPAAVVSASTTPCRGGAAMPATGEAAAAERTWLWRTDRVATGCRDLVLALSDGSRLRVRALLR